MWKWIVWPLVAVGVIIGTAWLIAGVFLDSWFVFMAQLGNEFWTGALFPNGWNLLLAGPTFWIFVIVAIVVIIWIWAYRKTDHSYYRSDPALKRKDGKQPSVLTVIITGGVVVALLLAFAIDRMAWFNEDQAKSYMPSSTFIVSNPDKLPSVIAKINPGTIKVTKGSINFAWDARSASATGAAIVLQRTSSGVGNTQILSDTLEYLYNKNGTGVWSAIRNGINQQPIYSVATWDGKESTAQECRFTGDNSLNYAFDGRWGKNLTDKIATAYPRLMYNMDDVWGYCKDGTPTIVIPVIAHHGYNTLITDRAAGVLVINGSASGEPVIKHIANVKPGEFPGPVYPSRLVDQQRDSLNWAAGFNSTAYQGFGFDTTDVESQAGNVSDYLLKSKTDGHLYWVTPLKPSSTDTQTIVAYSITRADETKTEKLNEQKVYVLNDGDIRAVNLDSMTASVNQALKETNPGFFTGSTGRIAEFLPLTDSVWQVFAENSGRVVYRIDVNVNSQIAPKIYDLDGTSATQGGTTTPSSGGGGGTQVTCDDPSALTDQQLIACLNAVVNELNTRQITGPSTSTPTPAPTTK